MSDESPKQFLEELKQSIFRRRIGQIALAIVLAEAIIRYLNALTWNVVSPIISNGLKGHTESVLFPGQRTFPWDRLAGSTLVSSSLSSLSFTPTAGCMVSTGPAKLMRWMPSSPQNP